MANEMTPDYRTILLQLIGSLTLADHMGDVSNDVAEALKHGFAVEWDEWSDLQRWCAEQGITTLHGTSLASEDESNG